MEQRSERSLVGQRDSEAEGWKPITLEAARASMRRHSPRRQVHLTGQGNSIPVCRLTLTRRRARNGSGDWSGTSAPAFTLDTPASDYIDAEEKPFPPEVVTVLDDSLNRTFEILGDELPYEIGMEVFRAEWPEVTGNRNRSNRLRSALYDGA